MATAPIDRDTQIQMMTQAEQRHTSLMEELCSDDEVLSVLFREPNKKKKSYVQTQESVKVASYG